MSYWVHLSYKEEIVKVPKHKFGGTYLLSGTDNAELNVTYNYSTFYYKHLDKKSGLNWLHGKKAKKCINKLLETVSILGTERSLDYWEKTAGNAGFALLILASWAKIHPEATFEVS